MPGSFQRKGRVSLHIPSHIGLSGHTTPVGWNYYNDVVEHYMEIIKGAAGWVWTWDLPALSLIANHSTMGNTLLYLFIFLMTNKILRFPYQHLRLQSRQRQVLCHNDNEFLYKKPTTEAQSFLRIYRVHYIWVGQVMADCTPFKTQLGCTGPQFTMEQLD